MTKTYIQELNESVQSRLFELGYYRGRIDGVAGPLQEMATAAFKMANGLAARPYPGPITLTRLFSADAIPRPAPSGKLPGNLEEGFRLNGIREVPGPGNNPTIMRWSADLDLAYSGDDIAWCGLFAAHCNNFGFPLEPQDFNRLGARQWLQYGVSCPPILGSTVVFWRTHPTTSWHGHVAFPTGVSSDGVYIRCLGGNQDNMVKESWFTMDRVLGFRAPQALIGANPAPLPIVPVGELSKSEA